jgi:glycosyltransferase involved in cell wall biosynthesis
VAEYLVLSHNKNDNVGMSEPNQHSIAVLIPCYNEAATVAGVIECFRQELPQARICVFDNNSSDKTAEMAKQAGAEVWQEQRQGKGNVVRRMFSEIEADIYLMVDGDATYDPRSARAMIQKLTDNKLDMVVARRVAPEDEAYRAGHELGNRLLTGAVAWIFGHLLTDILSGYRAMSRRFVKSFPAMARGFETETELTIHALQLRLPVSEIESPYFARPQGSISKLNTWSDGFRILATIVRLFILEKPLQFFFWLALIFFAAATVLFVPVLMEYFSTGKVLKFPSLIVAVGGYIMALISLIMGTILYTSTIARLEAKRFQYMDVSASQSE